MARTCPKCGLGVADGAAQCGHCGGLMPSDFVDAPATAGASRPLVSARWEITAALEGHGTARTYLARNRTTEEIVCLRSLPSTLHDDDATREKITDAIARQRVLAGTPGIVASTGMEVEDRHSSLITESFRGTSLQDRMKKEKTLPPEELLRIGAAVADALGAAHARGIPHGELRPASVILEEGGEVRVADFLVGKIVSDHSIEQMGAGPPKSTFYRSPEIVRTNLPDARSDLYALGCVLYEAALGERRFPDAYNETCKEPRSGALFPDPFDGRHCDDDRFKDVVRRLVAPDPTDRFDDAAAASAALRGERFSPARILTGAAAALPSGKGGPSRTGRLDRHNPIPVAGVVVGILVVAGFGFAASVYFGAESKIAGITPEEVPPPPAVFVPAAPVITDLPPPPEPAAAGVKLPARFEAREGRIWSLIDGAEMVLVAGGEFLMGEEDGGAADTRPRRTVTTSPFLIDRHEVTVAQFKRFCDASSREMPPQPEGSTTRHPVVNVTWTEANAFAAWAAKRLPTEAEWEKAARGTRGLPFPWGESDDPRARNGPGADDGHAAMAPAGSLPEGASPFGCLDMIGNAWEWCADRYAADAYATGPSRDPHGPQAGGDRVVRGGSFLLGGPPLRAAFRNRADPGFRFEDIGFRCAVSLP